MAKAMIMISVKIRTKLVAMMILSFSRKVPACESALGYALACGQSCPMGIHVY